jgi:hypothetical protein
VAHSIAPALRAATLPRTPSMAEHAGSRTWNRVKLGLKLALLAAILLGLYLGGDAVQHAIGRQLGAVDNPWTNARVLLATAAYIVMLALPYVPGMEISVALLVILGAPGALLVWAATLAALSLSYGAGRLIPISALTGLLGWLRLKRAQALVQAVHPLTPDEKLALLLRSAPSCWVPFLLRHRYVAIAIVLNLPGNAVIGGGGGIGTAAGLSGLFRYPVYLLAVAIAAAPIPLAVWLFGGPGLWGPE